MLPIVRGGLSVHPLALVAIEQIGTESTERCASPEARMKASPSGWTYAGSRPCGILGVWGRRIMRV